MKKFYTSSFPRPYKISLIVLFAFFLYVILFAPKFKAETITLYPIADAEIYSGTDSTNYGSYDIVEVGHSTFNGHSRFSYFKFDISGIPAGATLDSVWLSVYLKQCDGNPISITVKPISGDWAENEITWKMAPAPSASPTGTTVVSCNSYEGWSFDSTQIIQNWRDGQPNYGLGLFSESQESYLRTFYSREYPILGSQPKLFITYTLPALPEIDKTTPTDTSVPVDGGIPDSQTPTGDTPAANQPGNPDSDVPSTNPNGTNDEEIPIFDITIPKDDWEAVPLLPPLAESMGLSLFPCLMLLCCCLLIILLLLVIFWVVRKMRSKNKTVERPIEVVANTVQEPTIGAEESKIEPEKPEK